MKQTLTLSRRINRQTIRKLNAALGKALGAPLCKVERRDSKSIYILPDCPDRNGFALHFSSGWLSAHGA